MEAGILWREEVQKIKDEGKNRDFDCIMGMSGGIDSSYLLYMMMISEGEHKTAHYAICTGIMALGMMIPGMFSGSLQESIGYLNFFYWVIFSTLPGLILIKFISINSDFGLKKE